jgi:hypothetical protein
VISQIIKGDSNVIWGLIYELSLINPHALPKEKVVFLEDIELPYSVEELQNLESSLLNWMKDMGVLKGNSTVSSLRDIESVIWNGTLLCELV